MSRDDQRGTAVLTVVLDTSDEATFADRAGPPKGDVWPDPVASLPRKQTGRVLVVLDPGHGGIDPGASREGQTEKELILAFAREIEEELRRLPNVDVLFTRTDDNFVSL